MTGAAILLQDMKPEGTVYGAIVRPPTYTAKLIEVDTAAIEKMPGVIKVVRNGSFLGVVAEREEQAIAAAAALGNAAKWDVENALPGTEGIFDWLTQAPSDDKDISTKAARDGGEPGQGRSRPPTIGPIICTDRSARRRLSPAWRRRRHDDPHP